MVKDKNLYYKSGEQGTIIVKVRGGGYSIIKQKAFEGDISRALICMNGSIFQLLHECFIIEKSNTRSGFEEKSHVL